MVTDADVNTHPLTTGPGGWDRFPPPQCEGKCGVTPTATVGVYSAKTTWLRAMLPLPLPLLRRCIYYASLSLYKNVMYVYEIKNPVKWRRSPVREAQMGIIADTEAKYHTTIYVTIFFRDHTLLFFFLT